jgi:hypothetical protein
MRRPWRLRRSLPCKLAIIDAFDARGGAIRAQRARQLQTVSQTALLCGPQVATMAFFRLRHAARIRRFMCLTSARQAESRAMLEEMLELEALGELYPGRPELLWLARLRDVYPWGGLSELTRSDTGVRHARSRRDRRHRR